MCNIHAVNDSELALAALLAEVTSASGYALAALARTRGMERWAGLSATSVYQGLRKLENRGFVTSTPDTAKTGRGPAGRLSTLTGPGLESVRLELATALSDAPEQSARYKVALASVALLDADLAVQRLTARTLHVADRMREVSSAQQRAEREDGSIGARLIFEYVRGALEYELAAAHRLRDLLTKERP